jgi:hypothetical protein
VGSLTNCLRRTPKFWLHPSFADLCPPLLHLRLLVHWLRFCSLGYCRRGVLSSSCQTSDRDPAYPASRQASHAPITTPAAAVEPLRYLSSSETPSARGRCLPTAQRLLRLDYYRKRVACRSFHRALLHLIALAACDPHLPTVTCLSKCGLCTCQTSRPRADLRASLDGSDPPRRDQASATCNLTLHKHPSFFQHPTPGSELDHAWLASPSLHSRAVIRTV